MDNVLPTQTFSQKDKMFPRHVRSVFLGHSSAGKSWMIRELLKRSADFFPVNVTKVMYIWPSTHLSTKDQEFINSLKDCHKNLEVHTSMIDESHILSSFMLSSSQHTVIVFDDMNHLLNNSFLLELWTRYSNHASM